MAAATKRKNDRSGFVPGPAPSPADEDRPATLPTAAVAARLAKACAESKHTAVVFLAADERRADEIGRALLSFATPLEVLTLPPWDCLPYDRVSPSLACMGRRVGVLQKLASKPKGKRLLVTSPEAVMQKVGAADPSFTLRKGGTLDRVALEAFARRSGYLEDERVDEPGDIAPQGQVIDVFPADGAAPVRIDLAEDGTIEDLRVFDTATQRTEEPLDRLDLVPASELTLDDDVARTPGIEHRMSAYQRELRTLFELMPDAAVAHEKGALQACPRVASRLVDAYDTRRAFAGPEEGVVPQPDRLYLTREAFDAALAARPRLTLDLDAIEPMASFASQRDAMRAFAGFVRASSKDGDRVVVAGCEAERVPLLRALRRGKIATRAVDDWRMAAEAAAGDVVMLDADLERGFVDRESRLAMVTASDVFGARAATPEGAAAALEARSAPQPGDVVVHEDHGVAILKGLESVEVDGGRHEVLRLSFHDDAQLLAPTDELDRIWRYGSAPDAVTLDRLNTDGWNKRRVKVNAYVEEAAARLVALAAERTKAKTPPLVPPAADYARFTARFPFPETRDQAAAVAAVLDDLASGRPMNRLVCGDVGYGKTEVALRAAAAVAFCGRQVALIAPTTVLARQHVQTFERRFAGTDVEIVHLSRLVSSGDAKAAKRRLASGEAGIVIGTQAVSAADVDFDDLALVIVDEEHRFGTKTEQELQRLAPHHLALSATPIPRTLQGALVGVQDVSVLATPPARRRPVRTFLSPFDKAAATTALMREKRRNGQSFVVVPRIEEIDDVLAMLKEVAPKLSVDVAHGKLSPEEVDEAMVRFADGARDVLVATSLIENGLDVPRANTILIWGADRFGLAQLHQLRGRVGRGRVQGTAYLFAPDDEEATKATAERLSALLAADRLGAGFELSSRDLDLRGGGDLVGEEQAGHMRLIGSSLYQNLLQRAVRAQKGETLEQRRPPSLQAAGDAGFPASYVPDEALRLELYTRLAHAEGADDIDAFRDELDDRFGDLPPETDRLLARRRISLLALGAGVTAVVIGPKAAALTFLRSAAARARSRLTSPRWKDERLILDVSSEDPDKNLASLAKLLSRLQPDERTAGSA